MFDNQRIMFEPVPHKPLPSGYVLYKQLGINFANQKRSLSDLLRTYYVSEKLDGGWAAWDGKYLWTRNNKIWPAPPWWLSRLPKVSGTAVLGELYMGRGRFQETMSITRTRSGATYSKWMDVYFHAFDATCFPSWLHAQEYLAYLHTTIAPLEPRFFRVVEQYRMDEDECNEFLNFIWTAGGEGAMLRGPAPAADARNNSVIKLKAELTEVFTVTGVTEGKGRHAGRMGALRCVTKQHNFFDVGGGFTDAERDLFYKNPPKQIEVAFLNWTDANVPRHPNYVRTIA